MSCPGQPPGGGVPSPPLPAPLRLAPERARPLRQHVGRRDTDRRLRRRVIAGATRRQPLPQPAVAHSRGGDAPLADRHRLRRADRRGGERAVCTLTAPGYPPPLPLPLALPADDPRAAALRGTPQRLLGAAGRGCGGALREQPPPAEARPRPLLLAPLARPAPRGTAAARPLPLRSPARTRDWRPAPLAPQARGVRGAARRGARARVCPLAEAAQARRLALHRARGAVPRLPRLGGARVRRSRAGGVGGASPVRMVPGALQGQGHGLLSRRGGFRRALELSDLAGRPAAA
mmetsp:Transcript_31804/g.103969  ORF Transcript_31804/g.103969 Transcript_31804/m.103969 type:complete len:290 (+) Transcript_31804:808-1677(+)